MDHPLGYIEGEFIEVRRIGNELLCKIRLDAFFVEPEELEVKADDGDIALEPFQLKVPIAWWYSDGYVIFKFEDGTTQSEHRYVMECFLGRKLTADEVVHHIDQVRDNNSIRNLQLTDRVEHPSLHDKSNVRSINPDTRKTDLEQYIVAYDYRP